MDTLAVMLWTGTGLGAAAVVAGVVDRERRRAALLLAGVLFLPIGVLGIMTIGGLFLVASVLCLVYSGRPSVGQQR